MGTSKDNPLRPWKMTRLRNVYCVFVRAGGHSLERNKIINSIHQSTYKGLRWNDSSITGSLDIFSVVKSLEVLIGEIKFFPNILWKNIIDLQVIKKKRSKKVLKN